MTFEEFDAVGFRPGMTCLYDGRAFSIGSVNFPERLLGLREESWDADEEPMWVRCENARILE